MFLKFPIFCAILIFLTTCDIGIAQFSTPYFRLLGIYTGRDNSNSIYRKAFFYPNSAKATWEHSKAICMHHGMELASFKTLNESRYVHGMVGRASNTGLRGVFLNGVAIDPLSFSWADTGEQFFQNFIWHPTQPDGEAGSVLYLSSSRAGFNDITPYSIKSFLCQMWLHLDPRD